MIAYRYLMIYVSLLVHVTVVRSMNSFRGKSTVNVASVLNVKRPLSNVAAFLLAFSLPLNINTHREAAIDLSANTWSVTTSLVRADEGEESINVIAQPYEPKITAKVTMDVQVSRSKPKPIEIGLYGNDSPGATRLFLSICGGVNDAKVSYDESQVSLVQKDKKIVVNKFLAGSAAKTETWMDEVGKVRIRSVNLADRVSYNDENSLKHSQLSVSMPKGGGSFGFTISPPTSDTISNSELDKTNLVIGKVTSDTMGLIREINEVPVSREDILGTKGAFSNAGKGFDVRAKIISINRPLQKIKVLQCEVTESASVASFLKF